MDENKQPSEKPKEGMSFKELEDFGKKYTNEIFAALAVLIATISSLFDFFIGAGLSILFAGIGAIVAVIFPEQIDKALGKFYGMIKKQEKATQIIIGIVKVVVALFVPFVLFALMGLIAGSSRHLHVYKGPTES
ncbi:MAG: hypothetical protein COT84_00020 [Chlamydiae bacterium CG10_big_fil_rev_8_21_14_0_10_35_9]|nr:MAG: hypothetical protein COT84_00020 [Chlamydiae bacterium CG10_big_fil_rev_8_21_14_0_10_35_9]